jgi:hypothetical protein
MSKGSLIQRDGVNFLMIIDKKKPKSNLEFINGSPLILILNGIQKCQKTPLILKNHIVMNKAQSFSKLTTIAGILVYAGLLVLISLYVFVANDESAPLIRILDLNYLIPVLIYSLIVLSVSHLLFLLLQRFLNKFFSFSVSIVIGIPAGLFFIVMLSNLLR